MDEKWLSWAVELQSLAQAGLYYGKDAFDLERYERVRQIAAEMMSSASGLPVEQIRTLFCNETGYQTPKLDCRAAIFRDERILLVRERNGEWSLPGGWVDIGSSVAESVVREAKEEAGLDVTAGRLIAVQDRARHNTPEYVYSIIKVFVLCTPVGGRFAPNTETTASGYFALDDLPPLSLDRVTPEQLALCYEAYRAPVWEARLD